MRIAILSNTFPPDHKGGAERVAALQAEGLRRAGHEVHVWVAGKRSAAEPFQGVTRFASPNLARMNPIARFWFHFATDNRPRTDVADDILAWKPEKLITHNLTGCGIATPHVIQSYGVPWTHILHDIQLTNPSGQETDAWSQGLFASVWRACWSAHRRRSFGRPDILVSPTAWLLEWHRRHGFLGTEEAVIPNPIEIVPSRIRTLKTPATVVYIGRLSRDKGFDIFLDTARKLSPALVNQVTVVGSGPLERHAKRLADPRLDLVGSVPPPAVRAILAEADLLIAPSRILENQQNILLEAMAVGTPIVATDVGGTRETLEGTGCSVVMPTEIAAEAAHLLSDTNRWSEVSRKMHEHVRNRHDASKI